MSKFGDSREELNEAADSIERFIERRLLEGATPSSIAGELVSLHEDAIGQLFYQVEARGS